MSCSLLQLASWSPPTRRFLVRLGVVAALATLLAAPARAASPLVLAAEAAQEFYREGAENEIYVQARVSTELSSEETSANPQDDPAENTSPPVRNIAFVLDRSGSMDGERMEAMRSAVSGVLETLNDRDIVAVVAFGSEVETIVEAQPCTEARTVFSGTASIEAAGGAALYDGLSQGAAQVRRFASPESINQLIIVTDGPATKGPREREDFVGLVESLVRDGVTVSTIGLGDEFEEDVLASIARAGRGRFRFAPEPSRLAAELAAEISPARPIVALHAVLTLAFRPVCDNVEAHGAPFAAVERHRIICRYPRLLQGDTISVVASGVIGAFATNGIQRDLIRVTLGWTDPTSGEPRELTERVTIRFLSDIRASDDDYNLEVYRAAVSALATEGLQKAIEQFDTGDPRRGLRELRRTREQLLEINYHPQDAGISATIERLGSYIADLQARGMTAIDRKILRSGLFNQFEMPVAAEEAKRRP